MNSKMKQQLINDVLTGLAIAAAFAAVMPLDAFAQSTLSSMVSSTSTNVMAPFQRLLGYGSYTAGTVFTIAGIAGAKKHADNPGSNPLGPALGKLGAGAAFLAAPGVVGVIAGTGTTVMGNSTGTAQSIGGF